MNKKIIYETFGWYGALATIAALFLNSFGYISSESYTYILLNLTGGLGVAAGSFYKKAFQPALLNVIWTSIAIAALVRIVIMA